MHLCCRLARRFRLHHHAFYTGVFRAPAAIGTVSHCGSGLRIGMPRFIGNFSCGTGLFLRSSTASIPRRDGTDDRLSTSMHVDVLDGDPLLALAAVTVKSLGQRCIGAREFVGLVQALASTFEGLIAKHRAPAALHSGVMDRDQLCAQHPLKLVARLHAFHGSDRCVELAIALLGIAVLHPQRSGNLSDEDPSEILVIGAADQPQRGRFIFYALRRLLCPHSPLRVIFSSSGRSRPPTSSINAGKRRGLGVSCFLEIAGGQPGEGAAVAFPGSSKLVLAPQFCQRKCCAGLDRRAAVSCKLRVLTRYPSQPLSLLFDVGEISPRHSD